MRWLVLLLLLAGACSRQPQPPENQAAASEKVMSEASIDANSAAPSGKAENQAEKLPPASASLRFVGTWAASQAECTSKPWIFTEKALSGAGAPKCSFYKISKAPGGYDIAATCPAKEPVHTDLIRLRFAESAGAMLVESNAIQPSGLIYCGK